MTSSTPRPWAILLCRYKDDTNDPSQTRVSDLYQQWLAARGQDWVATNLTPDWRNDPRTILELYQQFFTTAGGGTYNSVRFWDEMSQGSIDVSGSQVFPLQMDLTEAEAANLPYSGPAWQEAIFERAKAVFANQHGPGYWKAFYGVVVSFQWNGDNQGGQYDGGPGVFSSIKYVRDNGMDTWGQEMGHAFGLGHSRMEGSDAEYGDAWDAMSTRGITFSHTLDPNYGERGIGFNAWNMRALGWLDESRVWKGPAQQDFHSSVVLRPLHRRDLSGYLAAELPAVGTDSPYLVEYRVPRDWDMNIPKATVLVHRFEGEPGPAQQAHSFLEPATSSGGAVALSEGDVFHRGSAPFVRAVVRSLNFADNTAIVDLCYSIEPETEPSIAIRLLGQECDIPPVEGLEATFKFEVTNLVCREIEDLRWSVQGTLPVPGASNSAPTFSITPPDPSVEVTVSILILFDDGSTAGTSYKFHSVTSDAAFWHTLPCQLLQKYRFKPIPWYEWDPEKVESLFRELSPAELKQMVQRTERVLRTLEEVDLRRQP